MYNVHFEMSENVEDLRKNTRELCVETFVLHCIRFYGQTTNNDLKLLVNCLFVVAAVATLPRSWMAE